MLVRKITNYLNRSSRGMQLDGFAKPCPNYKTKLQTLNQKKTQIIFISTQNALGFINVEFMHNS